MSTLVVVKKDGFATIACDSLSTDNSVKVSPENKINNHKFFKIHDSIIGFVGWSNINNIFEDVIERQLEGLEFTTRSSIFKSLNLLHQILIDDYFINTDEKRDQPVESSQLDGCVVSPEGIFEFCSYRSVDEYSKYWATGSGQEFALGCLYNSYGENKSSEELAIDAVKAGCHFDDSSGLPAQFETIKLKSD